MMEWQPLLLLVLGIVFCFLMTFGVGANDLANVMSTTMGSKAVSTRVAIVIAIIFELMGAFFGGEGVTETMRDGIIDLNCLQDQSTLIVYGMLAILIAGTIWMNLASFLGVPVSITNAIVGSMVGFGAMMTNLQDIHWQRVGFIALSWLSSPVIAGIIAYLLMISIQTLIFGRGNPLARSRLWMPLYLFLVGMMLSFITILKGLHHFGFHFSRSVNLSIVMITGLVITILGYRGLEMLAVPTIKRRRHLYDLVERRFAVLVALTTCAMVFAHGANDVSIAVGPLTVIYSFLKQRAAFSADQYPTWIIALGCTGVIIGLMIYGRKVIETVGSSITALTPSRAFAAILSAATTVVVSTSTGIPVSATQTLVGAVLGVGLARGIGALNLVVIRNIFMSWVVTLPVSSVLTILCFKLLSMMLVSHH